MRDEAKAGTNSADQESSGVDPGAGSSAILHTPMLKL